MRALKPFVILCTLLLPFFGGAQPLTKASYEMMLETAEKSATANDYYNAIEWFEKAYEESKDPNLLVAIGDLWYLLRDFQKAQKYYERILKRDKKNEFDDIRLAYAKSLKAQGKYKDAMTNLTYVITTTTDEVMKKEATLEWKGIKLMDVYPQNVEAVIQFAGEDVNSASAESSPAYTEEGALYFSSFNRKNEIIYNGKEGDFHAKIYVASRNNEGKYDKPEALPMLINREKFNSGGVSFSADGQRMYFTRAKLMNNKIESSQLFISEKRNGEWAPPNEIKSLNGEFNITAPVEGELFGERVIFFASDMPGGKGGFDLYYATIKSDGFSNPVNLGDKINTAFDEITPFYKDGTLYFSSQGHPGMGGFDIFYANWTGSGWAELTNIGFNYNSSNDDFYFRFNRSGNAGVLVSNRPDKAKKKLKNSETCCDDIYLVSIREIVIDLQLIVNGDTGILEGASADLLDITGKNPLIADSKSNETSNTFSFLLDSDKSYKVLISRDGYYPDSIEFNTNGLFEDHSIKRTITLKERPRSEEYETYAINEPIRLNNIYYDYDDDKILKDAEKDLGYLSELMEQYGDMVIELSSHTDSRGDDAYNMKLSQKRADSAKRWLVTQGIDGKRIATKGYGESKLLNRCKNGVKCSDQEHRQNRRTEFKIIAGPQSIEIKKSRLKEISNPNKK